jgi:hypothetical protein
MAESIVLVLQGLSNYGNQPEEIPALMLKEASAIMSIISASKHYSDVEETLQTLRDSVDLVGTSAVASMIGTLQRFESGFQEHACNLQLCQLLFR